MYNNALWLLGVTRMWDISKRDLKITLEMG